MIKSLLFSGLTTFIFTSSFSGSIAQAKPQFSSRYFDTTTDCTCLEKNLQEGEDCTGFSCKEMAGYKIQVAYNGAACDLGKLKIIKNSKELVSLDEVPAKLEWRFADSQAFAVIYRIKGQSKTCLEQGVSTKTKEKLFIIGLEQYSSISGQIEVHTPNANVKSREIADQGFLSKLK